MLEAINASTGRNSATERKIPQQVLTGAFASGFKLALMVKDVGIAYRLARDLGIDAPYLREALKLWRDAQRRLPADADHTRVYEYLKRRSAPARRKPARARVDRHVAPPDRLTRSERAQQLPAVREAQRQAALRE